MTARSLLYVPGDQPEKLAKAAERGADGLILDLEDAVAPAAKAGARREVAGWLDSRSEDENAQIWIRINAGELMAEDVEALLRPTLAGIYLPKVSSLADIAGLDQLLGDAVTPVVALIETAAGILDAREISAHPRVVRLAIGEADLCAELGIDPSTDAGELAPIRMQVVLASAASGIDPPVGSVSTDFTDLDSFRSSTEALRRMGFAGRAAIHPAQVPVINEVFTPDLEEVQAARRLLALYEEAGGGVCLDEDGRMVDEAVVRAARRTLALAGEQSLD